MSFFFFFGLDLRFIFNRDLDHFCLILCFWSFFYLFFWRAVSMKFRLFKFATKQCCSFHVQRGHLHRTPKGTAQIKIVILYLCCCHAAWNWHETCTLSGSLSQATILNPTPNKTTQIYSWKFFNSMELDSRKLERFKAARFSTNQFFFSPS